MADQSASLPAMTAAHPLTQDAGRLTVFVSWSLDLSREVASLLRGWLPRFIQDVSPWMSKHDIDKGTFWNAEVNDVLGRSKVGIVVVTPENMERSWLNYEAGVLARAIEPAGGMVAPLLVNVRESDLAGPLKSLQVTRIDDHDDFRQMIKDINKRTRSPLDERLLEEEFEEKWPRLQTEVETLIAKATEEGSTSVGRPRSTEDILEELVSTVSSMHREMLRGGLNGASFGMALNDSEVLRPILDAASAESVYFRSARIKKAYPDGTLEVHLAGVSAEHAESLERLMQKVALIPKFALIAHYAEERSAY